jgi:hypothetical protein
VRNPLASVVVLSLKGGGDFGVFKKAIALYQTSMLINEPFNDVTLV